MNWRRLHAWAAILWVVAIIAQVILAGQAIGNLGGSGDFATHRDFGYTMGIVQLVALILAFPARMSRRDKAVSAGLLVLYIVQTILPPLRSTTPLLAELHPLNAMKTPAPRAVAPCPIRPNFSWSSALKSASS